MSGGFCLPADVGPVRNYARARTCSTRTIPSDPLCGLTEPLIRPDPFENEGYGPDVLYSCGRLVYQPTLPLPYVIADGFTTFASASLDSLLAAKA
ncbi:MAG: hypothetical protein ABI810_06095 [Sphingomonas bacterium]